MEELEKLRGDTLEEDPSEEDETSEEQEEEQEESEEQGEESEDVVEDPRFAMLYEQIESAKSRNAWLEEQLSKLIAKGSEKEPVPQEPKFDFEAKEEEYASLIIEGETAKASKLRAAIDAARTKEIIAIMRGEAEAASKRVTSETQALLEVERFSKTVEIIESRHPFFDPKHKDYNEEAVDTANDLILGFVNKGMSRVDALKKAVERLAPLYSKAPSAPPKSTKRVEDAGRAAADAARRQPPKSSGVKGESVSPKVKPISAYTDKEFASLSAAELKALRGDI